MHPDTPAISAPIRADGGAAGGSLPTIRTETPPDRILENLIVASRRGRLPGFARGQGDRDTGLFSADAHGNPFDGVLVATHSPAQGPVPAGLTFRIRMLRRMPAIFLIALVVTVWPGVYFTDELIAQFAPGLWRPWVTYYWYIPLTLLPAPWIWKSALARSRRSMFAHATETIRKIAVEIGGRVDDAQATPR
jgi:hypothetical protein